MSIVLAIHLIICAFLVILVLLQQGKGADVGAAFGGGSNTLFGATGANNLMVKITTFTAFAFMVTSILLIRGYSSAVENAMETGSREIEIRDPLLDEGAAAPAPAAETAPVAPAATDKAPAATTDSAKSETQPAK